MRRLRIFVLIAALPRTIAADATCDAVNPEPLVVPVVDLADVASPSTQAALADACRSHGLFRPSNHGIGADTTAEAHRAHRAVFNVLAADKLAHPIEPGGFTRGFVALGSESGDKTNLECKEAFSYGHEWSAAAPLPAAANPLQGANQWASVDAGARYALGAWFRDAVRLAKKVAVGLADALDLPAAAMADLCDGGETISLMRLFRYVPARDASCVRGGPPEMARVGSSPHTDWGFLTVVLGDGHGGLQVFHGGEWRELEAAARAEPLVICGNAARFVSSSHGRSIERQHVFAGAKTAEHTQPVCSHFHSWRPLARSLSPLVTLSRVCPCALPLRARRLREPAERRAAAQPCAPCGAPGRRRPRQLRVLLLPQVRACC